MCLLCASQWNSHGLIKVRGKTNLFGKRTNDFKYQYHVRHISLNAILKRSKHTKWTVTITLVPACPCYTRVFTFWTGWHLN